MTFMRVRHLRILMVSLCLAACVRAFCADTDPTVSGQSGRVHPAGFRRRVYGGFVLRTQLRPTGCGGTASGSFRHRLAISVLMPGGCRADQRHRASHPTTLPVNHPVNASPYGPSYIFGYFEARMRFLPSPGGNVVNSWGAFWMFSKAAIQNQATDANGNKAWCEIDVAEMFTHNLLNTTIHSWYQPSGGTPQDTSNPNHLNYLGANDPIDGYWHTFGVLWKSGVVTWYMDNAQVATYRRSYAVCNSQPMTPRPDRANPDQ